MPVQSHEKTIQTIRPKWKGTMTDHKSTLFPLVERGGYIPFCDHRCPPNVNPDDYLYYLDLKEEYFGLKG